MAGDIGLYIVPITLAAVTVGLFIAIVVCKNIWEVGRKNIHDPPEPVTLKRFILHEHPLLSIMWSSSIITWYQKNYMNTNRRAILFADLFLLNFIVAGIIFAVSQPAPTTVDCNALNACFNNCTACSATGFQVGAKDGMYTYEFPESVSPVGYATCGSVQTDARVCFPYCRQTASAEYFIDERPQCSQTDASKQHSLACILPSSIPACVPKVTVDFLSVDTYKSVDSFKESVAASFSIKEVIIRIVLTIVLIFPASIVFKGIFRCTTRAKDTAKGRCSRVVGWLMIVIFVLGTIAVTVTLIFTLKSWDLVAQLATSFMISFYIGLLLDVFKLCILFCVHKKKMLNQRYETCYTRYEKAMKKIGKRKHARHAPGLRKKSTLDTLVRKKRSKKRKGAKGGASKSRAGSKSGAASKSGRSGRSGRGGAASAPGSARGGASSARSGAGVGSRPTTSGRSASGRSTATATPRGTAPTPRSTAATPRSATATPRSAATTPRRTAAAAPRASSGRSRSRSRPRTAQAAAVARPAPSPRAASSRSARSGKSAASARSGKRQRSAAPAAGQRAAPTLDRGRKDRRTNRR